jgi:hypothetical protein
MAGKKKAQPPKASSSKGTTASRGKALELSIANEEQIRNILKVSSFAHTITLHDHARHALLPAISPVAPLMT